MVQMLLQNSTADSTVQRCIEPGGMVVQKSGPKTSAMIEADESWTLDELLKQADYVMPGVPVLFIVAKGGAFYERAKMFDPYSWTPPKDSPAAEP